MGKITQYKVQDFTHLNDLVGITKEQIKVHLGLYEGYVKNVNLLNQQIYDLIKDGKIEDPTFSELKRRLGFEYGGMRLHELYFENLINRDDYDESDKALDTIGDAWGSWAQWEKEFTAMGLMRGIGWVVTYQDPTTKELLNGWITLHNEDVIPSFKPILVMDVWEHAYMVYRKPTEKKRYIEDFCSNINWKVVEERLK